MENNEEDALSRKNTKDADCSEVLSSSELVPIGYQQDVLVLGEVGTLAPEKIEALNECLRQDANCLDENPDGLVEWDGYHLMTKIIRRHQSCFVVGENGSGKSCAAILAAYDLERKLKTLKLMVEAEDVWDIYKETWYFLEQPIPPIDEMIGPTVFSNKQPKIKFPCHKCPRHCVLYETNHYMQPEEEDIQFGEGFMYVKGKCPLIRDMVFTHSKELEDNVFVIKIPDVNDELITLLTHLKELGEIILLANHEQTRTLRKYTRFSKLPVRRLPKPPLTFFYELIKNRMESLNLSKTPFTMSAINCAIVLSKYNPGKFIEILSQALEESLMDEEPEVINPESIFNTVSSILDENTMIELTLMKFSGWTKVKQIRGALEDLFYVEIDGKRLGRILTDKDFEQRNNPDSEYFIPSVPILPDITKVTKVSKNNDNPLLT